MSYRLLLQREESEQYDGDVKAFPLCISWGVCPYNGASCPGSVRYKDDVYDRIWRDFNLDGSTTISRSSTFPTNYSNTLSEPPFTVLSTADTPNASDSLYYSWVPDTPTDQFYIYMHFTEVQVLKANQTREFLIYLNGQLWYNIPVVPTTVSTTTIFGSNTYPSFELSINKTSKSTLPPIINAIEIYNVRQLNSLTDEKDGEISPSIYNLTMIQSLDLSNNNLTGQIPDFLSQLAFLKVLIDGAKEAAASPSHQSAPWKIVVPVVELSLLLLLIATFAILYVIKRRKQVTRKVDAESNKRDEESLEEKKRQFTYSEILSMTNNFQRVVGKGGFGTVYHGYIDDTQVAVKILSSSSIQGYKEFQAEAKLLMSVHHKNLTSLVGYCNEGTNMGIVYEYMANGNLIKKPFIRNPNVLMWEERLRIAVDVAQGLEYLHHGCKPPIIHRDVKSTNILLNEKFQAKLADFGLSRVFPIEGDTHVSTIVAGTPGYLDPE
ncbi:hypothetical protein F0562_029233 [Nyssa sinensis]|uniref:non-specific serine/threonine protein kinase n=1 Tax=Nyssa sinensis TaxID=561372 RepID=A0A5J5B0I1_9ASTE|nr:hypothetical protein F0562_029233 [Nyssa sinensis]